MEEVLALTNEERRALHMEESRTAPAESSAKCMWEILVPTVRRIGGKPYTTRFHRVWDSKVRELSGGLTIMTPAKGQWVAPDGELFVERMIPVRIVATHAAINKIIDHTLEYYDQLAVLCYKISDEVILRSKP